MSDHANTIRVALRPGMTAGEALAALAALAALEAELAEARANLLTEMQLGEQWRKERLNALADLAAARAARKAADERITALVAELAEARREVELANFDGHWDAKEAAEVENARLKAALAPFFRHPRWLSIGSHENTAEIRVSREVYKEAVAALASGSEGDTA